MDALALRSRSNTKWQESNSVRTSVFVEVHGFSEQSMVLGRSTSALTEKSYGRSLAFVVSEWDGDGMNPVI